MFSRFAFIFIVFIFSQSGLAIEPSEKLKTGRFQMIPSIKVILEKDDNLFDSVGDQLNVILTEYTPRIITKYDGSLLNMKIDYRSFLGSYDESPIDDYDDHHLKTYFEYKLTRRSSLDVNANYLKEHSKRSSNNLDFSFLRSPDEYDQKDLEVKYTFGRDRAKGKIELFTGFTDIEYTNNRVTTFNKDRDKTLFGVGFQLRLSPRSRAFLEIAREDFDYKTDPDALINIVDTLDSERDSLFTGFRWSISNKTDGEVKLGYIKKNFKDDDREDFSALSWQADVVWVINSQSRLNFYTSRADKESDQGTSGGYIDEKTYSVAYRKDWATKVKTTLRGKLSDRSFIDYTQKRDEVLVSYGFRLDYSVQRWLDIGMSVDIESNDATSDFGDFDYDRNSYAIYIKAGF